jgi:3-methyladenine DNA glycosylase AlkD
VNPTDVRALVEAEASPRARDHWVAQNPDSPLEAIGVGLTKLRRIAKKVGRDAELAASLWDSDVYELKLVGLLVDDPKRITVEQAERQVEQLADGQLAHVFASCDATLAKSDIAVGLAESWTRHTDAMRRRCGQTLVYELSKSKKKSAPDDAWFQRHIAHIDATWRDEDVDVRMAMATALMGMGKRSAALWPEALRVARDIGPIDFDPTGGCDPMDVTKHIDAPGVRKKLGIDA